MKKVHSKILSIVGNVITVKAKGVAYEELAEVRSHRGKSLAQVIKIDKDLVSLQVFAGSRGVSTNDQVVFLGHPMKVSFSEDMLGRVFDGSGRPRDKGPDLAENTIEISGPTVNPVKRTIPERMIRTN
ncbi:MAG: V-type ATP synthase subunit B, partial [Candidatus Omnitrophica bacterium]|nr:V-type ATP synthase subunit B [Candidatus Omnitrophota bacterium]